jgi:hypothetical protein
MTTYLGEKAVGIGTIKATSSVSDVLHDNTLTGNGNTEPLGVNTEVIATKEELESKQDKLTAGENITIEDGVISATGGGASGDYLPLSGGELTGSLKINIKSDYDSEFTPVSFLQLIAESKDGKYKKTRNIKMSPYAGALDFDSAALGGIASLSPATSSSKIGNSLASSRWKCAYVKNLNNGADIAIPTTGGTMALKEDIDAAVGDISTALTAILGE